MHYFILFSPISFLYEYFLILAFFLLKLSCLLNNTFFFQNFLFTSKDENAHLKAIDFGLSDFVKPGILRTGQSIFLLIYLL